MKDSMLTILQGDALEKLRGLPTESVHCCVTSPPYWGLRDYSTEGQFGLEKTPEEYVARMLEVFREVRRVLRKDGTLWLNMGDSYMAQGAWGGCYTKGLNENKDADKGLEHREKRHQQLLASLKTGLKPKDLCGIPWRLAFALQTDGWWLRSDCIWAKPNPMPESCTDRPTKSHEYLFLLTKSASYFYDAEAIREPELHPGDSAKQIAYQERNRISSKIKGELVNHSLTWSNNSNTYTGGRNKRTVWTVATAPYPEAHFATYPPDLIKPCILAGSKPGDMILRPLCRQRHHGPGGA